ncbi:hypothetical protein A2803_04735 [Candidatus Woesebacteria bacterium RIFCSPHIGHO2_01_FULL_44_21]|uniref:Uncharacterized protein n=1 Tax=Candidatus Woesebacteria bacterium RIFCSPHIGHO2_01_FULL_44_21 TaxID=1802503 RepID=A0A1F7Z1I4_9BACT|nr:MAG: hypothetical protein A2803_04735 [Candidatus Woesebacteria bacterium RIFCSPHIGHO2_01_FULL_44_21]OGM69424.1 MAG: hypothetical protein A2897_03665 [Candidatus Woesebacteria bacterium RIFCSPLOWO2_01_FULL_44_24b]
MDSERLKATVVSDYNCKAANCIFIWTGTCPIFDDEKIVAQLGYKSDGGCPVAAISNPEDGGETVIPGGVISGHFVRIGKPTSALSHLEKVLDERARQ